MLSRLQDLDFEVVGPGGQRRLRLGQANVVDVHPVTSVFNNLRNKHCHVFVSLGKRYSHKEAC